MENRILHELEENPALEELPDVPSEDIAEEYETSETMSDNDLGDYLNEDDIPDYKLQQAYSTPESRTEIPYSEAESFHEYLLEQLRLKNLSEEQFRIGAYIIGNLDDDGYMRRDLQEISDDFAFQYSLDVPVEQIRQALHWVQELDPAGIAATDLQECLLLQLRRKMHSQVRECAIAILTDTFDLFVKKQYPQLLKTLGISEEELKKAIDEITLLNPKPGNAWESNMDTKLSQITPDFIVETTNGDLIFSLANQNLPELRVNQEYNRILSEYAETKEKSRPEQKEAVLFVKQKIDSAKWFIDAIKQRNQTLQNTMLTIIDIQREFFLTGEESDLKPMILKDVAERCGYDISTISRVSNSKYVQTNWGIFPLRYFFSESMTNDEGEEISTREIKVLLKNLIDAEDKSKPITDDALSEELKQHGYLIARRTVAKYREQLNIPIARMRKEI
jgi:RNA polymerase sigma-54 factor